MHGSLKRNRGVVPDIHRNSEPLVDHEALAKKDAWDKPNRITFLGLWTTRDGSNNLKSSQQMVTSRCGIARERLICKLQLRGCC